MNALIHGPGRWRQRNGAALRAAARFVALAAMASAIALPAPGLLRAQEIPPGMVGEIQGSDVSVSGGVAAPPASASAAGKILVANGSEVIVHSGQARMTLFSGAQIDLCGPAKLTPLRSGGAVTLALNFGQAHIQTPAGSTLRIFMPTIVATPIGINGAQSDLTLGLSLDDTLCVHAASGAIQLEDQFTGEKLIVPQDGEFTLAQGKLVPAAGPPGSCMCTAMPANVVPAPSPILGLETAAARPLVPRAASAPVAAIPPAAPTVPPGTNESHPIAPPPASESDEAPEVGIPAYKVDLPPLEFSAAHPAEPSVPAMDTIQLAREAQVEPSWLFQGRVEAPPVAAQARPHGFWHALKRLFFL